MDATDLDNPMQTCPYDESHRIAKSRMQWHLVRCRKNHPVNKDQMKTCPFDAVHIINSIEYEYHVANCPKSGSVFNFMFSSEGQRCVGSVSLEESNNVYVPPATENWDADPPAPTYDPRKHAKSKNVLLFEIGLSKAKKRQFKNSERLRIQALEESGVITDKLPEPVKEDPDKPLRLPHKISQAFSLASETSIEDLNEPEIRLRPPRSKSVAMSVCSNTDYAEEILNSSRPSNSTKRSQSPVSALNASETASATETAKKTNEVFNQSIRHATKQNNVALEEDVLNSKEVPPIDPRFLLTELATSVSSSSTADDNDSNFYTSSTDLTTIQSDIQPILNPSDDDIEEIAKRLEALNTLEQNLARDKAKLKQQFDEYYASRSASHLRANNNHDASTNPRCAANFSKAKEDPESRPKV